MKQKNTARGRKMHKIASLPMLTLASLLVVGSAFVPSKQVVTADQFDDQINALRAQNAQNQNEVNGLRAQAASFQDAIYRLQMQISGLQALINANLAAQARLQQEIVQSQAELDKQRAILGADIKSMYIDGQITTIEMLATSKSLSEFVDKETYRNTVQKKIQQTLATITKLQNQLKVQKVQVDQLLKDQQNQQAQLDSDRAQQAQLLSYNQGQQASYNREIAANQSKIGDLRRQQAILNARYNIGSLKSSLCGGGYPNSTPNAYGQNWGCGHPQDNTIDHWGMYNRQCVSYTAFKVHEDFISGRNNRDMPYWGGIGNANQWDDNARAMGIPVDSRPTEGSIAVSNAGTWGHVMYVEAVGTMNGQEAIYVSQYNAGFDGKYSEGWRYTTGLVFIHF